TARLSGTIHDQQGAPIPVAHITLINEATALRREAISPVAGEYLFLELPIGSYRLEVEAKGFRRYMQTGIVLSVNQSARNDVTLAIGDLAQEITVRGAAQMIDANTSDVKYTVDSARITDIPLSGRNILSLATLLPGVVATSLPTGNQQGTQIFVNGNRS